jgi:DNA-binding HxlR family transcriptional regulator
MMTPGSCQETAADPPAPVALRGFLSATCPTRSLANQLADKWSMLIRLSVADGPVRFNALKRQVAGVTQKMLGQTLRELEEHGLVERRVLSGRPVAVEYEITALGRTLVPVLEDLRAWAIDHFRDVQDAQVRFRALT